MIPSFQWFLKTGWSINDVTRNNRHPYISNIGMTTKSYSNRLFFFLKPSLYRSGSWDNCCQNVVSRSLIFRFPQIFCWAQSWKQSLFGLDIDSTHVIKKGTNRRQKVTGVSESHCVSSFNLSKSFRAKFGKRGNLKLMHLKIGFELLEILLDAWTSNTF